MRRIASLLAILACVSIGLYVYTQVGFDLDPRTLRARIESFGWLAPAAYMVVAALRFFLFLPSGVVMSAGGLLFGVWAGLAWGVVGFTAGALLSFGIARGLGREAVAARLHGRAAAFDSYLQRRGAPWMALYTAVPISVLSPVHAAAGLSAMTLGSFALAAVAGLVPRMALYSFFGDAIAQGDWAAVGGSAAAICLLGVVGTIAVRRWGSRGDEGRTAKDASRLEEHEGTP